jgi:hypothetical protein
MANKPIPITVQPIQVAPTHAIVKNSDSTFTLVNSDTGRGHVTCGDISSAQKEQARLNAVSAQEKF